MATTPIVSGDATISPNSPVSAALAAPRSRTVDQYLQTLVWTFAAILVCALGYVIEKYVFRNALGWITDSTYRMFKNPAELPMRVFGIPHFLVALMFMLSSRRMKGVRSWASLAFLTALGAAFCWLFWRFGTMIGANGEIVISPLALLAFYFYFLIHGFRDEAFFYRAYGEMPAEQRVMHERIMLVLQLLLLGLLISLALPAYVLYGQFRPEFRHPALEAIFPAEWPYALRFTTTFVPMLLIAMFALWRITRRFPDGRHGLWRTHRPILIVFCGSTGIILVALLSGPWTFNAVVLMHFVGWFIFARRMLAQRPPASPPTTTWTWLRTTPAGFSVLHVGLAALTACLIAISTYAFGKTDFLELVVGSKVFYFWTIMHVTLSFFPRA